MEKAPTQVKICGLSDEATLDAALEEGADFIGLVHFAPSPRHVSLERAKTLANRARGKSGVVILTVNADEKTLSRIEGEIGPDYIQFHGREAPALLGAVKARGTGTIKAFGVETRADLAPVPTFRGVADWVLLDAKPPKDATRPGGLGVSFDWHLLDSLDRTSPLMLSGGLKQETVAAALHSVRPQAVDVSSGVETAPGIKSVDLIRAFIRTVRAADAGEGAPSHRPMGQEEA